MRQEKDVIDKKEVQDHSDLTAELERESAMKRAPQPKPLKSVKSRTWRIRVTVTVPVDFDEDMVKAHVTGHLKSSFGKVTRVREVLE